MVTAKFAPPLWSKRIFFAALLVKLPISWKKKCTPLLIVMVIHLPCAQRARQVVFAQLNSTVCYTTKCSVYGTQALCFATSGHRLAVTANFTKWGLRPSVWRGLILMVSLFCLPTVCGKHWVCVSRWC